MAQNWYQAPCMIAMYTKYANVHMVQTTTLNVYKECFDWYRKVKQANYEIILGAQCQNKYSLLIALEEKSNLSEACVAVSPYLSLLITLNEKSYYISTCVCARFLIHVYVTIWFEFGFFFGHMHIVRDCMLYVPCMYRNVFTWRVRNACMVNERIKCKHRWMVCLPRNNLEIV